MRRRDIKQTIVPPKEILVYVRKEKNQFSEPIAREKHGIIVDIWKHL